MAPPWTLGVEIELLAPRGSSRLTLAQAIAERYGAEVRRIFYPQSEPSPLPRSPVMENLTLGFEVVDRQGQVIAKCVDDLTLQAECCKGAAPRPGWYRIVSDEARLLRLVARVANAEDPLERVLDPVAQLFGVQPIWGPGGMVKVSCEEGLPIAIAAPLPGERERPCELISPPLLRSQIAMVGEWLELARGLGFCAPLEGAIHIHIDGTRFCSAPVLRQVITQWRTYGSLLRQLLGTNPQCQRLGPIPEDLWRAVQAQDWLDLEWSAACAALKPLNPSKYRDVNFRNLIFQIPHKPTIEVRILPVWLEFEPLEQAIDLIQALFERSLDPMSLPLPCQDVEINSFLDGLDLPSAQQSYWLQRWEQIHN